MTTRRFFSSLLCPQPDLRPVQALVTGTWWAALAILIANDHLFKAAAGGLPTAGFVTGKLSDLAGLVVAPALLATLLRVRSRRGLFGSHLAVAVVFAAINLSTTAAAAWTAWLGLFGLAWAITVDPTDLLTLPALGLGWVALLPAMRRNNPTPVPAPIPRRLAQTVAICAGTAACVATSESGRGDDDGNEVGAEWGGEWGDEWGDEGPDTDTTQYLDINADVYLHNASASDLILRTRDLRSEVLLDCLAVTDNPGLLLSESLFDAGRTWTMPPRTNAAARDLANWQGRTCHAVRVEGDALTAPFVVFWQASEIPITVVPGAIDDPAQHSAGGVTLEADADGFVSVTSSQRPIVHPADPLPPVDAYFPASDLARIDWSAPPITADPLQITRQDLGADGCYALEWNHGAKFSRWYLCVPTDAFPFELGNTVTLEPKANGDVIQLTRIPGVDDDPDLTVPATVLMVTRGQQVPTLSDFVLAAKPNLTTTVAPDPVCGTAARPAELSLRFHDDPVQTMHAGEHQEFVDASATWTLWLAHSEDRIILDPTCAEGPDQLGGDYELAIVYAPVTP